MCILAFTALLLYPFALSGQAFYWGDLYLYFYPMQEFVRRSLLDGFIPLWNPYVLCGQPMVGNPQSWVFYPGTLLLPLIPTWLYFTVSAFLHLAAAGLGGYLFLKRICHDRLSALAGAMTFAGSSYFAARLQFPNMAQSAAYLPWLLLLVDRVIAKPGIGYASLTAAVVSLSVLAGHAQIAYMTILSAGLYALTRLYQSRRHGRRAWRAFSWLSSSLVVGILGSAVQVLPALQLFQSSTREQLKWYEANRFAIYPEQLLNFISPRYFGHPADGDYWGRGNLWEVCVYVGIAPLALAGFAVIRKPRRPAIAFFALLGLICLLLAMGRFGGLFWLAYYVVPGVSSFHDPARFVYLTTFSLAVLCAIGMRLLREQGVSTGIRGLALSFIALNLLWFSSSINPSVEPEMVANSPRPAVSALEGRVFSYRQRDVWDHFVSYKDYGPQNAGYLALLTATLTPNALMRSGLAEGGGYEPVPIRAMTELDRFARESIWRRHDRLDTILSAMNIGTLAVPSQLRFAGSSGLFSPGWRQWINRHPGQSHWLVDDVTPAESQLEGFGAFTSPAGRGVGWAAVEDDRGQVGGQQTVADAGRGIVVDVANVTSREQVLVRSATYYPGWQVHVDKARRPLLRVNGALQGVRVPPGRHDVSFQFRPQAYTVGLYVSLLSIGSIAGGLVAGLILRVDTQRRGFAP